MIRRRRKEIRYRIIGMRGMVLVRMRGM